MKKYNYKSLKSIREKLKLSQAQMGERLNMSQSNYNKLENNHKKIISIDLLDRLSKALGVSSDEIQSLLTESKSVSKKEVIEKNPLKLIGLHEEMLMGFIYSAFESCASKYEEGASWEELDEHGRHYVVEICEIKSKKEYDNLPYSLVGSVSAENNQVAFEEMIESMNIYSCFEFGIINDEWFLGMWNEYKKKNDPKFTFNYDDGVLQTTRRKYEELNDKNSQ